MLWFTTGVTTRKYSHLRKALQRQLYQFIQQLYTLPKDRVRRRHLKGYLVDDRDREKLVCVPGLGGTKDQHETWQNMTGNKSVQ